jgi:hypothetical protein
MDDNFQTDRKKFNKFKNSVESSKAEKELKYKEAEEERKQKEEDKQSHISLDDDEEKAVEPGDIANFWCNICYR